MRHLGQKLIKRDADRLKIEGGDINIKIAKSDIVAYSYITNIKCHLNTPDNTIVQLGNIQIKNEGKLSTWYLSDLYQNNITKN